MAQAITINLIRRLVLTGLIAAGLCVAVAACGPAEAVPRHHQAHTLQKAPAAPAKPKPVSMTEANATLKQVLADDAYKENQVDKLIYRVIRAIGDFLSRHNGSSIFSWGFVVVVLVAFVAVLVYLVIRLVQYYSVTAPDRNKTENQQIIRRAAPSVLSVIQIAEKQAAQGLYRDAYRNTYLAAILALDKAKLVKYADGVTNWEYLRTLSRQPIEEPKEVFQGMTVSFDKLIYGKKSVSSDDYAACVEQYKSLEEKL